ncbi:MAG: alpha/beta fold hydrolase [Haloarculaceae archaeon]
MEHGWGDADGTAIHYLAAGDPSDPTVLLLHGGVVDCASLSWGGLLDDLAEGRHVLAPDLAGYGESDRPDADYSTAWHVGVVESFLDDRGLDSPSVVGLSLGGGVALGLALRSPDRVDHLVPVDSYGLGRDLPNGLLTWALSRVPQLNRLSLWLLARSERLTRASLGGIVVDPSSVPEEVVAELHELVGRPGAGEAFRRWRRAEVTRDGYRTDYTDRLDAVDVPTLFVHGEADDLFPVEWARAAAERVPDARLETFEGVAHWPPREAPDRLLAALDAFLPRA